MTETREFDFEEFKKEAIKGMYAGKPMNRAKGVFCSLIKALFRVGTRRPRLQGKKASGLSNRRNGKTSKRIKSISGKFDLESTRERSGSFEPMILPKRQLIVTDELEENVIGLYGLDVSNRDIASHEIVTISI